MELKCKRTAKLKSPNIFCISTNLEICPKSNEKCLTFLSRKKFLPRNLLVTLLLISERGAFEKGLEDDYRRN